MLNEERVRRVESTRSFKRVYEKALANGAEHDEAYSAASTAGHRKLDDNSPGWDKGVLETIWSSLFS